MRSQNVKLAFSNPHARVTTTTASTLVIELPDFPGSNTVWSGARVSVTVDEHVAVVEVSRSVNTSNEIYLVLEGPEAALVVTDHFLTALRHCSFGEREPTADAIIDHFLYRNLSGEMTYARGVVRVGHGRTLRWNRAERRLNVVRRETLDCPPAMEFSESLDILGRSLANVIAGIIQSAPPGAVTNLLSGGVDSTLLQVLFPKGSPSLSFGIDTPEFAPELGRALVASRLTGSDHQVIQFRERDYLEALERFLRVVGLPPHHLQSIPLVELFRQFEGNKSFLVTAQLADAAFGLGFATRTAFLRRWGPLLSCIRRVRLPTKLKPSRMLTAENLAVALRHPVGSARGVAARIACYTDFDFVEKVFGTSAVEKRLQKRLEYVLELCPFLSPEEHGPDAHVEAGHMVDYFCDDAISIWRQGCMSHGGYLIGPFTHPAILQCSLAVSARERYWRRGESKPALKALLRRYLPEYDTRLTKLSTGLPIRRFLESGPLQRSHYLTPPDFFPRLDKVSGGEYPPWIVWSLLTLRAWQSLACRNDVMPPLSLSRTILMPVAHLP
jgi:asparagine synthase (glutamine-hydrolysing)